MYTWTDVLCCCTVYFSAFWVSVQPWHKKVMVNLLFTAHAVCFNVYSFSHTHWGETFIMLQRSVHICNMHIDTVPLLVQVMHLFKYLHTVTHWYKYSRGMDWCVVLLYSVFQCIVGFRSTMTQKGTVMLNVSCTAHAFCSKVYSFSLA